MNEVHGLTTDDYLVGQRLLFLPASTLERLEGLRVRAAAIPDPPKPTTPMLGVPYPAPLEPPSDRASDAVPAPPSSGRQRDQEAKAVASSATSLPIRRRRSASTDATVLSCTEHDPDSADATLMSYVTQQQGSRFNVDTLLVQGALTPFLGRWWYVLTPAVREVLTHPVLTPSSLCQQQT
eukprot:5382118-Prymnesium_polylepis.1